MEAATGLTSEKLRHMYPDVYKRTYFLPSAHFNLWNLHTGEVDDPQVHVSNIPQTSERRGSEAEQRVLCSLQKLCSTTSCDDEDICPMFVLSGVNFKNILKKQTPKPTGKKKKKGRPGESETNQSVGQQTQPKIKGEADILIIQKSLGLIIIEVKAVEYIPTSQKTLDMVLGTVLEKINNPLESATGNSASAEELPCQTGGCTDKKLFASFIIEALELHMPASYVVAFPNVSRTDLERVVQQHPDFVKVLKSFGGETNPSPERDILRTRCLCKEEFPEQFQCQDPTEQEACGRRFAEWWRTFSATVDKRPPLNETDYEKAVAGFVGPYSEITVWSPKDKRMTSTGRYMHSQDDVIGEAGARYRKYVLYPEQLELYKTCNEKYVYLTGPPGCGKTLLMILKAAKWMSEGSYCTSSTANEEWILPTDGPPIKWLSHQGHGCLLTDCSTCGRTLGRYLVNELHVGSGGRLEFRDVIIVTRATSLKKTRFLKGLNEEGLKARAVESGSGKEEYVAFPIKFAIATDISLVLGLERMVVVFVPESLTFGGDRRGAVKRGENPQRLTEHRRLLALGEDNRKALWYVLSRSLSHGVIFHFGEEDDMEVSSSSGEIEESDNDVTDDEDRRDNTKDEESKKNTGRGMSWMFVILTLVLLVGPILAFFIRPTSIASYGHQRTPALQEAWKRTRDVPKRKVHHRKRRT